MSSGITVATFIFLLKLVSAEDGDVSTNDIEYLTPYVNRHGSVHSHRYIRDCHRQKYGTQPNELYPAQVSPVFSEPFLVVKNFVKEVQSESGKRFLRGHYAIVSDPMKTFSVLEPDQERGCSLNVRQTVAESARRKHCVLAVNAGFFNTKNGSCLGNVVSDGKLMHDSKGIQNAHFGLLKDGNIFAGYLSEEDLHSNSFQQLVGGILLVLKQGKENVNFSQSLECESTEETGTMDVYINVLSARTVVGHDAAGKIIIVQVDGKTHSDGASLLEMEAFVKELGMINAVNLDGGGSATFVVNGTVINLPTDRCPDRMFTCSRKVSTILCVHEPYCEPEDCSGHGKCVMGKCLCDTNWLEPRCDQLYCSVQNCSGHGVCTSSGCICQPGLEGEDCENECKSGWFGLNCKQPCLCLNNATCDHVIGSCSCKPGFMGPFCQRSCPNGLFGENCENICSCENSCFCDTVTGMCNNQSRQDLNIASHCIALQSVTEQLGKNNSQEEKKQIFAMIFQSVVTTICVTTCLLLVFFSYTCYCKRRQRLCRKKKPYKSHLPIRLNDRDISDSSSESELVLMKNTGNS